MDIRGKDTSELVESLATLTSPEVNKEQNLDDRLARYGRAKLKALSIRNYILEHHPGNANITGPMSECGSFLVFRNFYTLGETRLFSANFCRKHLLCPLCAIARGGKVMRRYFDRYEKIILADSAVKPYLVTLTVRDGESLGERITHLMSSFRSLCKRRHGKRDISEIKKASAAVFSYEVKRGANSGLWHPHVHCLMLCSVPIDQAKLSSEWHRITGDSFIVDVRPIDTTDPIGGFLEVFKYAVKFSDQPPADTWHCFEVLTGRRLIGSFGDFYGFSEPETLSDDMLTDDLPYIDMLFQYSNSNYRKVSSAPRGSSLMVPPVTPRRGVPHESVS